MLELSDVITSAVYEASAYVLSKVGNIGAITAKSTKDFVSEVDKEAERMIITHIQSIYSEIAFYGEETGYHAGSKKVVVIDPVDATTNFIRGIPLFDVAVSLYENNMLTFGAVACPALGELYTAKRGEGAYLNGKRIRVTAVNDLGSALIGYNRSNHPDAIIASSSKLLSLILENAMSLRIFGTGALDYCVLAKGGFDACITPLAEPFHSAGYIIMEEAGAKVTDYEGNQHTMMSTTIVAAHPDLHEQVRKIAELSRK